MDWKIFIVSAAVFFAFVSSQSQGLTLNYSECVVFNVSDGNNSYVNETVCSAPSLNVNENVQFRWADYGVSELLNYSYANAGANVSIVVLNTPALPACVNYSFVPKLNQSFALQSNQSYRNESLNLTVSCAATVVNDSFVYCPARNLTTFSCVVGAEDVLDIANGLQIKMPRSERFYSEAKQGDYYTNPTDVCYKAGDFKVACGSESVACPVCSNVSVNTSILEEKVANLAGQVGQTAPAVVSAIQADAASKPVCATNESLLYIAVGIVGAIILVTLAARKWAESQGGKVATKIEKPPVAKALEELDRAIDREAQFKKNYGLE